MSNPTEKLEHLAVDAHAAGQSWGTFWARHGDKVKQAEPWNRQRFNRLVRLLLHLHCTGEASGQHPVGDPDALPWEVDDQPVDAFGELAWENLQSICGPCHARESARGSNAGGGG